MMKRKDMWTFKEWIDHEFDKESEYRKLLDNVYEDFPETYEWEIVREYLKDKNTRTIGHLEKVFKAYTKRQKGIIKAVNNVFDAIGYEFLTTEELMKKHGIVINEKGDQSEPS